MPVKAKSGLRTILLGAAAATGIVAVAGCSVSDNSSAINTQHQDQIDVSAAPTKSLPALPTNDSKGTVELFISDVNCTAIIAGRPRQVCDAVHSSLCDYLATSKNFIVRDDNSSSQPFARVGNETATRPSGHAYQVLATIVTFERGLKTNGGQNNSANSLFMTTSDREKREGQFVLNLRITDKNTGSIVDTFATTAPLYDDRKRSSVDVAPLGMTNESEQRSRSSDMDAINSATHEAALRIWNRLMQ